MIKRKEESGITLIALIITIIVLLILAGVSISLVVGENGIISRATGAREKTNRAEAKERIELEVSGSYDDTGTINIDDLNKNLRENLSGVKLKVQSDDENTPDGDFQELSEENKIKRLPVTVQYKGYDMTIEENGEVIIGESTSVGGTTPSGGNTTGDETSTEGYIKEGSTYCNVPDLSGFNPACTYYVIYNGDEIVSESQNIVLDESGKATNMPEGWYDYGDKKWANIVTKNGGNIAYWVWIPRYKYKITEGIEEVDVKFVTTGDVCKQEVEGKEQEVTLAEDYKLPESFSFGGETLAGFWISKYEVQDGTNTSTTGLQSKKGGTRKANKAANNFFEWIRLMETEGGTLGKTANIDKAGGTYKDSTENGIDCHMAKNTEWGTVAMLTASMYGNAPSGPSSASTTGNETGVYEMSSKHGWEFVAGVYAETNGNVNKINAADERYRNLYETQISKVGDATTETEGWYEDGYAFGFVIPGCPIFVRGAYGIFTCNRHGGYGDNAMSSRAVVVCGRNL